MLYVISIPDISIYNKISRRYMCQRVIDFILFGFRNQCFVKLVLLGFSVHFLDNSLNLLFSLFSFYLLLSYFHVWHDDIRNRGLFFSFQLLDLSQQVFCLLTGLFGLVKDIFCLNHVRIFHLPLVLSRMSTRNIPCVEVINTCFKFLNN